MEQKALVVFEGKNIRRLWHNEEWWFSVVDVVGVLSESADPRNYWKVLKHRLIEEGSEAVTNCNQLKLPSSDGKYYETDCANTEALFRIIQSIPSPKAEPFKRWLAKVGYERIQEIQNPELAQDRVKHYYELKGYPKDWIDKWLRGIVGYINWFFTKITEKEAKSKLTHKFFLRLKSESFPKIILAKFAENASFS